MPTDHARAEKLLSGITAEAHQPTADDPDMDREIVMDCGDRRVIVRWSEDGILEAVRVSGTGVTRSQAAGDHLDVTDDLAWLMTTEPTAEKAGEESKP